MQEYEDEEEDDEDEDDEDTGMGDEGEDSNEGTGSVDGNDGYDADETEVRMPDKNGLLGVGVASHFFDQSPQSDPPMLVKCSIFKAQQKL